MVVVLIATNRVESPHGKGMECNHPRPSQCSSEHGRHSIGGRGGAVGMGVLLPAVTRS
jgi:hypothetical protein